MRGTTEIVAEPPGAILVELAWSTAFGDVDLHVLHVLDVNQTPPAGWWTANDCYFANRTPDWDAVAWRRTRRATSTIKADSGPNKSNGTSLLPASLTSARHCEISCAADSDCPTGERCATVGGGGPPRRACVLNR